MFEDLGVTQKIIARLCDFDQSTVSRWLMKNDIKAINREKTTHLRYSIEDAQAFMRSTLSEPSMFKACQVISFYNFKGGTGKTSLCYQISFHLALIGFRVLVIDADPQGHLSTSYGFQGTYDFPTLADALNGTVRISECIHSICSGLDVIPSNLSLTRSETILNDLPRREERIKSLIGELKNNYDLIIFDSNPNISLLNRNILVASDLLCLVCETQPYSLNGMKLLIEDMKRFYSNMEMSEPNILVIPNKYEDRSSSSAEAMTVLRQYYEAYMIPDFAIRRSEDIINSSKLSLPLALFVRHNSNALADVIDLMKMIVTKLFPHHRYARV